MAVAVELLHLATLIHDDTVDDSDLRRGRATISSLWGRNVAVLLGDYLFASAFAASGKPTREPNEPSSFDGPMDPFSMKDEMPSPRSLPFARLSL